MNPAEVVVGEPKAVGSPKIVPLLAETVRQARKSAHLHSDGEIIPLDNRGSLVVCQHKTARRLTVFFSLL
jgi:hypothetical protein